MGRRTNGSCVSGAGAEEKGEGLESDTSRGLAVFVVSSGGDSQRMLFIDGS